MLLQAQWKTSTMYGKTKLIIRNKTQRNANSSRDWPLIITRENRQRERERERETLGPPKRIASKSIAKENRPNDRSRRVICLGAGETCPADNKQVETYLEEHFENALFSNKKVFEMFQRCALQGLPEVPESKKDSSFSMERLDQVGSQFEILWNSQTLKFSNFPP